MILFIDKYVLLQYNIFVVSNAYITFIGPILDLRPCTQLKSVNFVVYCILYSFRTCLFNASNLFLKSHFQDHLLLLSRTFICNLIGIKANPAFRGTKGIQSVVRKSKHSFSCFLSNSQALFVFKLTSSCTDVVRALNRSKTLLKRRLVIVL